MTLDANALKGINGHANHVVPGPSLNRATEVDDLLSAVQSLLLPFIKTADDAAPERAAGANATSQPSVLVDAQPPKALVEKMAFSLPGNQGRGRNGLLETIQNLLKYSVNTWDQGFLDKLYASTNAVGVVSELVLSVLNTNLHIYNVSPALTAIERQTANVGG